MNFFATLVAKTFHTKDRNGGAKFAQDPATTELLFKAGIVFTHAMGFKNR
jgi:hypothetical protein